MPTVFHISLLIPAQATQQIYIAIILIHHQKKHSPVESLSIKQAHLLQTSKKRDLGNAHEEN